MGKTLTRKGRTKAQRQRVCKRLDLLIDARGIRNIDIIRHFKQNHGFEVDPGTITHWRAGNSWPGLDLFDIVCDLLKVRPGWFWTDDDVPEVGEAC